MRHAGPATLERIAPLLEALRARPALRERRPGVFSLGSRAFLHFHDDPAGVFADVRLAEGFVRQRVSTAAEQAELLGRIDDCLAAVEARAASRARRDKHGRRAQRARRIHGEADGADR